MEERQGKLGIPQTFNSISANHQAPPQLPELILATNDEYASNCSLK